MPSGGARAQSGPPPDPNALARERDGSEWTVLPAQGRIGELPVWPLTAATDREMVWWRRFWAYPQAVEWEKRGLVVEVAVYVRRLTEVEQPGAPTSLGTLVRQLSEQLGLTIPGMLRLKWHLGKLPGQPAAAAPAADGTTPQAQASSRNRFRVIDGEAGA